MDIQLLLGLNLAILVICLLIFSFVYHRNRKSLTTIVKEQYEGMAIIEFNIAQIIHDFIINEQIFEVLKEIRKVSYEQPKFSFLIQKVEEIEKSLRNVSEDIYPAHLVDTFPESSIHKINQLKDLYEYFGKVSISIDPIVRTIKQPFVLLGLYRLLISFVGNSLKHHEKAKITEINVHLFEQKSKIVLKMSDNGLGFDIPKALQWDEMQHRGLADLQNLAIVLSINGKQSDYEFYSLPKKPNFKRHGTFFEMKINYLPEYDGNY